MVALIAMVTIAELLVGDAGVSGASLNAESRHLSVARRIPR
jgi:hypothetical protein